MNIIRRIFFFFWFRRQHHVLHFLSYVLTRKFIGHCVYNMKHPYLVQLGPHMTLTLQTSILSFTSLSLTSLSLALIKFFAVPSCAPLSYSLHSTRVARQCCKGPCLFVQFYMWDSIVERTFLAFEQRNVDNRYNGVTRIILFS